MVGLSLTLPGGVDAVGVAERSGDREAADRVEDVVGLEDVFRARVELVVLDAGVVDAVLLAAGDAELDLQRHVHLGDAGQRPGADLDVLRQRLLRKVEHVRAEEWLAVAREVLLPGRDDAVDPGENLLGAVVGVEHDRNAVDLGQGPHVQRAGDRTGDRRGLLTVVQRLATVELRAGVRQLDDDRRLGLLGGRHRGVRRVRTDHVDRRQRGLGLFAVGKDLLESVAGDDPRFQLQIRHRRGSIGLSPQLFDPARVLNHREAEVSRQRTSWPYRRPCRRFRRSRGPKTRCSSYMVGGRCVGAALAATAGTTNCGYCVPGM